MTCPKCETENQQGNFCGNCATPLKEKCHECGEMEPIQGKVCQTTIQRIVKEAEKFSENATSNNIDPFMVALTTFCIALFAALLEKYYFHCSENTVEMTAIFGLLSMFPIISIGGILYVTKQEAAKNEFYRLHPDYTEIIKKAEGKE